jgi:D-alanyl-D-alanine carboxypeptidase/D-alanyl-D-alanine-endopeptidase (penicillin-binding protein 4)
MILGPILSAFLLAATQASPPPPPLSQQIEALFHAGVPGARFGLLVVDDGGREIVSIDPGGRFIPGSNVKMVTTAAAFATLDAIDQPDATGGAAVRLESYDKSPPDVVLEGHGDARLSAAPDCAIDCLATLADAVAAKTKRVHDLIGDDSLFPDERWSPGMSWNNIPSRSGTATSALTIDDNEMVMMVKPAAPGATPIVTLPTYYQLDNRTVTVAAGSRTDIGFDRAPNGILVRLTGTIAADAAPVKLRLGIDDPALYAAWQLKVMLEARHVRVTGSISVRHRPLLPADDPANRLGAPAARPPQESVLAQLTPPALAEDLLHTNKVSQNLHAELLLRRVGRKAGSGSIADGLAVVRDMLARAGVARVDYDLADGSGMSSYDRLTPRGNVTLLRWIATQPWGAQWRATLPVGGVDGTLARRFRGTPLEGKVFAKTGTLNASAAISGWLTAASGRTLTFAMFGNDVPADGSITPSMDQALNLIAAAN